MQLLFEPKKATNRVFQKTLVINNLQDKVIQCLSAESEIVHGIIVEIEKLAKGTFCLYTCDKIILSSLSKNSEKECDKLQRGFLFTLSSQQHIDYIQELFKGFIEHYQSFMDMQYSDPIKKIISSWKNTLQTLAITLNVDKELSEEIRNLPDPINANMSSAFCVDKAAGDEKRKKEKLLLIQFKKTREGNQYVQIASPNSTACSEMVIDQSSPHTTQLIG